MSGRIPPGSEPLKFTRNNRTGTVHVCGYGPDSYYVPATRVPPEAQMILSLVSTPRRMVCGAKLLVGMDDRQSAAWIGGEHFDDNDLCPRCVHAMGDQSWRVFHSDNRGFAETEEVLP